jgi:hypothetical protein
MKNSLVDLNEYLFEQLDRLTNDDLTGEELETELKRAKSVSQIASNIVNSTAVILDAQKHKDEYYGSNAQKNVPGILKIGSKENEQE